MLCTTILCVGLNHTTAPVHVREHVASFLCMRHDVQENLAQTFDPALFLEHLILSTCNRTEIYCVTSDAARAVQTIRGELARELAFDIGGHDLIYEHTNRRAVEHLFEVAAGLDSLVLGEFEILGQIRRAYQEAAARHSLGPVLHQLFQTAAHTGKRARGETEIGHGAHSIAYAAVALARRQVGNLSGRAALIIGAGEMARRAAEDLHQDGACSIAVASRTYEHAQELARAVAGSAVPIQDLEHALARADVVISATRAPHIVLHAETIAQVMQTRPGHPLCLIDIAMPRNIDPAAGALPNVTLCNIDDLQQVVEHTRASRTAAIAQVRKIISAEVESFWEWHLTRRAAPLIGELYAHAESIRLAELDKALHRLNHLELTDREQNILNALTSGLVNKLLAVPTAKLKARVQSGDGQVYLDTLRELFDLPDPAE